MRSFEAAQSDLAHNIRKEAVRLRWALTSFIIALIADLLGFFGVAGTAAWIAKALFIGFLVLFVLSLLVGRRPHDTSLNL